MVTKRMGIMKTAAISELKARLSEYLNQVKAGIEVLITDRGNPVARLVPVSRPRDFKDSLGKMEKQGLIRLGSGNRIPRNSSNLSWRWPGMIAPAISAIIGPTNGIAPIVPLATRAQMS